MQSQELQTQLAHRQNRYGCDDDYEQQPVLDDDAHVVLAYVHDLPYEPGGRYVVWARYVLLVLQMRRLIQMLPLQRL